MSEEFPIPISPLSEAEQSFAAKLTDADLQAIDSTIMAITPHRFRKVAWIASQTEESLIAQYPELTFKFCVHRIISLVQEGRLEAAGNPEYPRFSEIQLPK